MLHKSAPCDMLPSHAAEIKATEINESVIVPASRQNVEWTAIRPSYARDYTKGQL